MTAIVDIHCHSFNADDLPVRGFIRRLHLRNVPLGAALSDLVDRLIQGTAPGSRADLARLDALLGSSEMLETVDMARPTIPQPPEQFEHEVDRALTELQGEDPDLLLRVGGAIADEEAPAGTTDGLEGVGDVMRSARRAIRWVKLFGRSRLDLVADYVRTFDDEVDLATPLLVDLGTGLGDTAKTSVSEQVVLFEKVSRASMLGLLPGGGKARVHPFVGFDPIRELRARRKDDIATPLEDVQSAVLRYGFVGVKVSRRWGGGRAATRPGVGSARPTPPNSTASSTTWRRGARPSRSRSPLTAPTPITPIRSSRASAGRPTGYRCYTAIPTCTSTSVTSAVRR